MMLLTAEHTDEITRPMLERLVARERARSGSIMTAYDAVARTIGKSGSWVRKYLGRQDVTLRAHELFNIREAYTRLCERIEAEATREELHTRQILERFDAALNGGRSLVASMEGAEGGPEAGVSVDVALRGGTE